MHLNMVKMVNFMFCIFCAIKKLILGPKLVKKKKKKKKTSKHCQMSQRQGLSFTENDWSMTILNVVKYTEKGKDLHPNASVAVECVVLN